MAGQPTIRTVIAALSTLSFGLAVMNTYWAYYLLIGLPPLALMLLGRTAALRDLVFRLMLTYLTCYAIYLVYPVYGPGLTLPRYAGPLAVDFGQTRGIQGRHAIETSLRIAPGTRAEELARRCAADGVEIPPVRVMHWQWFELVCGDDMVRQKRILAGVARPGARGKADEPDEGAGHCRERRRRRPDDRCFGRNVVRQAERGQCYV